MTIYSFQQLQEKYRIRMSFLKYHSLIHKLSSVKLSRTYVSEISFDMI